MYNASRACGSICAPRQLTFDVFSSDGLLISGETHRPYIKNHREPRYCATAVFRPATTPRSRLAPQRCCSPLHRLWAADSSVQHYEIPPAPLGTALNQPGQQTICHVVVPQRLDCRAQQPGLSGDYTVEGALQALLAGSQLIAVRLPDGRYTLQPAPATTGIELQSISISGKAPGSTTEGTGLYTTYSSSSSTRLNLTPQETPQSLTVMTRQRLDDQRLTNLSDTPRCHRASSCCAGRAAPNPTVTARLRGVQNFEIDGVPTCQAHGQLHPEHGHV